MRALDACETRICACAGIGAGKSSWLPVSDSSCGERPRELVVLDRSLSQGPGGSLVASDSVGRNGADQDQDAGLGCYGCGRTGAGAGALTVSRRRMVVMRRAPR